MKKIIPLFFLCSLDAFSADPRTCLKDLPDGTRFNVNPGVELRKDTFNESYDVYSTSFQDAKCDAGGGVSSSFFMKFDTQVLIRTDKASSVEKIPQTRILGATHQMVQGQYCLSKEKSSFQSHKKDSNWIDFTDRIKLVDCTSGEPVLTIEGISGYHLRNSRDYQCFDVGTLEGHTGGKVKVVSARKSVDQKKK